MPFRHAVRAVERSRWARSRPVVRTLGLLGRGGIRGGHNPRAVAGARARLASRRRQRWRWECEEIRTCLPGGRGRWCDAGARFGGIERERDLRNELVVWVRLDGAREGDRYWLLRHRLLRGRLRGQRGRGICGRKLRGRGRRYNGRSRHRRNVDCPGDGSAGSGRDNIVVVVVFVVVRPGRIKLVFEGLVVIQSREGRPKEIGSRRRRRAVEWRHGGDRRALRGLRNQLVRRCRSYRRRRGRMRLWRGFFRCWARLLGTPMRALTTLAKAHKARGAGGGKGLQLPQGRGG